MTTDPISKKLGAEFIPPKKLDKNEESRKLVPIADDVADRDKDEEYDYKKARQSFLNLINKGSSALEEMMDIAKGGTSKSSARDFEVISTLLKAVSDINKDLYGLHIDQKKNNEGRENHGPTTTIQHAVFNGSPSELLKEVNDREKSANSANPKTITTEYKRTSEQSEAS